MISVARSVIFTHLIHLFLDFQFKSIIIEIIDITTHLNLTYNLIVLCSRQIIYILQKIVYLAELVIDVINHLVYFRLTLGFLEFLFVIVEELLSFLFQIFQQLINIYVFFLSCCF